MVASNLILCAFAIFSAARVECRVRKFRVTVMRDTTSSRVAKRGGNSGSYGYGSSGGAYDSGGASMIMKMDETRDMSGKYAPTGGGDGRNNYKPLGEKAASGPGGSFDSDAGRHGNGGGNRDTNCSGGNHNYGEKISNSGRRSGCGQKVFTSSGGGYIAASSQGNRYESRTRMAYRHKNNEKSHLNLPSNQNNNNDNDNHQNNHNHQNQDDGNADVTSGGGRDHGNANENYGPSNGAQGQERNYSGDETTGNKETAEYPTVPANSPGSEGNEGPEKVIVVMNDATEPALSPIMTHTLLTSPHLPQTAPVFDSCFVPVNVCNTNNMMGGYGMGGMYGMNGMAMNGMGMNAFNGLGFPAYAGMPIMNMYGR